jgi:hypothetical protein
MKSINRQQKIVNSAQRKLLCNLANFVGIFRKISVCYHLTLWDITPTCRGNYLVHRVGVKKRLSAENKHRFYIVCRRHLANSVSGSDGIDALTARLVISLGAMLAPARAGKADNELNFIQIFKVNVHTRS